MKNLIINGYLSLILGGSLLSCQQVTEQKQTKSSELEKSKVDKTDTAQNIAGQNKTVKIVTDTVTFVEYDDNGDYPLLFAKKGGKRFTYIYNTDKDVDFLRDDQLLIKWKLDSTWIAGEGEKLEMRPWITEAKKIKDGSVANYRKQHKKPLKYWTAEKDGYSDTFKDYLYTLVEYYLANTKNELVKLNLKSNANLVYSIEDGQKNGRSYTILGLSTEFEDHSSIIVWLYLDNETRRFYEYDLANDKLVEFK
ncbi:hypothetical protein EZJ43_07945 [Pedobacter changchengzhani]|uniref:Lipoprotein n=1 Tax=Pedobacter changchengzhani TaxID=2529274 RepID=A0A4R5ML88_9SPHI|nr:hypothetical protein [Pedobacter changchengzhani]TDG36441.1 hypothetical protein EZJ43_07945 [Pedobacter changchengzhani]